jgi:hypothetical protein
MTCAGCEKTIVPNGPHDHRRKWCSSRCRKAQYAGTCVDCGGPTDGTNPGRGMPTRCGACAARYAHETARWTPEAILNAIRQWAADHDGDPPRAPAWLARHDTEHFPYASTVLNAFGTWNAAIEAAGFTPRASGHYGRPGEDPEVVAETVRLYRSGLSLAETGEALGVSGMCVLRRLQKAGEPRRPAHRRKHEEVAA